MDFSYDVHVLLAKSEKHVGIGGDGCHLKTLEVFYVLLQGILRGIRRSCF